MSSLFSKLKEGANNFLSKGGGETLFRKLKNSVKHNQNFINQVGKQVSDASGLVASVSPSLGLGLGALGSAIPHLADQFVQRTGAVQNSLKRDREGLQRVRAPEAGVQAH